MHLIPIIAAIYLIIIGALMNTAGIVNLVLFKALPILLGIGLIIQQYGGLQ